MKLKIGDPVIVIYDTKKERLGLSFVKKLTGCNTGCVLTSAPWFYGLYTHTATGYGMTISKFVPAPNLVNLLYGVG